MAGQSTGPGLEVIVLGAAVLGAAWWVWSKGGPAGAAAAVGAGVVNAAGAAASGAVGAVGATVGLPTPDETTTDPAVARWIIDRHGYFEASKWASAGALVKGAMLPEGSGKPPPAGTPAQRALNPAAPTTSAPTVWPGLLPDAGPSFSDVLNGDPYGLFRP